MYSRKLLRAKILAERFLAKATKRNDPLEAYRNEDTFKAFEDKTREIIAGQIRWAAAHLHEMKIDNEDLQEHQIKVLVSSYLDKFMPTYQSQMDFDTVHDNLKAGFIASIKAAYKRAGAQLIAKASGKDYTVSFDLTNQHYLDALKNDANYLLNTKSKSYDQTTKNRLVNIVKAGRLNNDTIDDVASDLEAQVDGISSVRAFMIANTETANAFGDANQAYITENDIPQKEWVTAGDNPCPVCQGNEDQGPIDSDQEFDSGDLSEPAHTSCECYTQGVGLDLATMSEEQLSSLVLWDGS